MGEWAGRLDDRRIEERRHDTYQASAKLAGTRVCSHCGAIYRRGRWSWGRPPEEAVRSTCPSCRRIEENMPAGVLTLSGAFLAAHRDEILGLLRHVEASERRRHPLKRIMRVDEDAQGMHVATTDMHLARRLGNTLRSAWEGTLEGDYPAQASLLRLHWHRDD